MSGIKSLGLKVTRCFARGTPPDMRMRFEFNLYRIAPADVAGGVDSTLALMGSQGWEVRGIAHAPDGGITLALQRPLDEAPPLPDGLTLAATLDEPLTAPAPAEFELLGHGPGSEAVATRPG